LLRGQVAIPFLDFPTFLRWKALPPPAYFVPSLPGKLSIPTACISDPLLLLGRQLPEPSITLTDAIALLR